MTHLNKALLKYKQNHLNIHNDESIYYNEKRDKIDVKHYYRKLHLAKYNKQQAFQQLHSLIKKTHTQKLPYFMSKDLYLYTWIELQPNGSIKNIYSGEIKDPEFLITEDFDIHEHEYIHNQNSEVKFNAEHIVPQSWFSAREPMKGDLHHLFACDPKCNRTRSNFPYKDFSFYIPESPDEPIRNHCGIALNDYFEPEYGKGAVARAMLYFITRYPNTIKRVYSKKINMNLLRKWHKKFPPDLYEKHRNQAIYLVQGNRNPFIDHPELINHVYFPL